MLLPDCERRKGQRMVQIRAFKFSGIASSLLSLASIELGKIVNVPKHNFNLIDVHPARLLRLVFLSPRSGVIRLGILYDESWLTLSNTSRSLGAKTSL